MTQIIAFAGRKQAGKDTACNFLLAAKIAELGISRSTRLNKSGQIEVTDIFGDSVSGQEWMPFEPPHVDVPTLFSNELGEFIQIYSFADKLKRMSIDILGLKEEWVFGTDEQKNTLTDILWEDIYTHQTVPEKEGRMTVREVLQCVGTDMFRAMYKNVWVDACLRQIEQDAPELALISDARFPNEVRAVQKQGGVVIGLSRNPYKKSDKHSSETAVEKCFEICDTVIDNGKLSIPKQNEQIYLATKHLQGIPDIL